MAAEPTNAQAVATRDLVVRYGDVTALDGLDLDVPRGAFFGLLGPNGAGKTTAVNVLATLVRPTAGAASLLGRDVVAERDAVRRDIGIVFQESTLDPDLTASEHLDLYGRLYKLRDRAQRAAEVLAMTGLGEEAHRPVRGFSGGMKRRLEIARGLLHQPRVLFLDEPTLGLDVGARAALWEYLRRLHGAGDTTVFLTTHYMEEADALCERIAILDRGQVVAAGAPDALKAALGGDVVRVALERPGGRGPLASCEGVSDVTAEGATPDAAETFRVTVQDGPRRLAGLLDSVRELGVVEVTLHRPTLEHVFLHHTGHRFEEDV